MKDEMGHDNDNQEDDGDDDCGGGSSGTLMWCPGSIWVLDTGEGVCGGSTLEGGRCRGEGRTKVWAPTAHDGDNYHQSQGIDKGVDSKMNALRIIVL